MAKRIFRKIDGFLSFKFFDRKSLAYWQNRWKERTGSTSARGWNRSPEFFRYRESIKDRIIKYAERNPQQFFEKLDYVLKYAKLSFEETYSFGGTAGTIQAFLNPVKGKWGLTQLIEQIQTRSWTSNKNLILIARVDETTEFELLDDPPEIVTSIQESDDLRVKVITNYGRKVARGLPKGTYELMGANYLVKIMETTTDMLAVIDMEIFTY